MPRRHDRLRLGRTAAEVVCVVLVSWVSALGGGIPSDSDFISAVMPVTGAHEFSVASLSADTHFTVAIMLDHATPLMGLVLPLTFAGLDALQIDTSISENGSTRGMTFGPLGRSPQWAWRSSYVAPGTQTILIGFNSIYPVPPAADTLCYIHFVLSPHPEHVSVHLDTTGLPPANHLGLWDPRVDEYTPRWTPFTITLGEGNFPPQWLRIADDTLDVHVAYSLSVAAVDEDGVSPELSASGLPAGASFADLGNGSGQLDWTPEPEQIGYHTMEVRATDGELTDSETVTLLVLGTNRPPRLDAVMDREAHVEMPLTLTVYATDPQGSTPALALIGTPAGALFMDHGAGSGVLYWTPGWHQNDYYELIFTASDGQFVDSEQVQLYISKTGTYGSDSDFLELVVPGAGTHELDLPMLDHDTTFALAVVISNATPLRGGELPLVLAGSNALRFDTSLGAPGHPGVTWGPAGQASMWSSRTSRLRQNGDLLDIAFSTSFDFAPHHDTLCYVHFRMSPVDTGASVLIDTVTIPQAGRFEIIAVERGSFLMLIPQWTPMTVTVGNRPPELSPLDAQTTVPGSSLNFFVSAWDPDGTVPVLEAQSLPAGSQFVDLGNGQGTFEWTPDPLQAGLYTVTFAATDGRFRDTCSVSISVGGTAIDDATATLPDRFELQPVFPNPFNAATRLRFGLPAPAQVKVSVFDALGRRVTTLVDRYETAGWHEVTWSGRNAFGRESGSGVYFMLFEAGGTRQIRRSVLLK